MRRLVLLFLPLLLSPEVLAQPEIVPAEHPVYDFLHHHRVGGRLPEYRHEARPIGRADVQALLDSLEARGTPRQGWGETFWVEFFEPLDRVESLVDGGVRLPRGRDTEKFFYYHREDPWRLAVSTIGRVQLRRSDAEGGASYSGVALTPELVIEGHYGDHLGFYSGTFNGQTLAGDTRVLQSDPQLAPLYYIGIDAVPAGSFDRTTASLRVAGGAFSAELAHERLAFGASFAEPLVLAGGADYFSFLRLGVETRPVQYQFVHGALGDQARYIEGEAGAVLVGPERYLALHRFTVTPHPRVSLAFSEMVVYGQRGPELAYLNPLYPFKTAEHALWDRDNSLFALDAVLRPLDGLELYGTVLADDLDFGELGQNSLNNKWAVQAGAGGALGPALGWLEYTRIEPWVYTHRFQLDGSFYNSYTHNGFGLGHPLGPNADQWEGGLRLWLPRRTRLEARLRYARRGENYVDPETGALVNVGGDVRDGRQPGFEEPVKIFLAGDVQRGPGISLEASWEPWRGLRLEAQASYQRWDRAADTTFGRLDLVVDL